MIIVVVKIKNMQKEQLIIKKYEQFIFFSFNLFDYIQFFKKNLYKYNYYLLTFRK